jgi:putative heme-binding domain-containing protein
MKTQSQAKYCAGVSPVLHRRDAGATKLWLALAGVIFVPAVSQSAVAPQWVWSTAERQADQWVCLRGEVQAGRQLRRAELRVVADFCHARVFINGKPVATRGPYETLLTRDVTDYLRSGKNTLGVCCRSARGPAAVFMRLDLQYADGSKQTVVSDKTWQAANLTGERLDWPKGEVKWQPVAALGAVARFPWGDTSAGIAVQPADDYTQWKRAIAAKAGTDPRTFETLPGYEVDLIRSAAKGEDSWVSLAIDPRGRLIVAQEKRGLLRLTLPKTKGGPVRVERINDTLAECRGLLFAHDSLYAMANNDKALFRLRDTNGDDRYDEVKRLGQFTGGVGHGRNQITLGPDGMIYGIFGDSVDEPADSRRKPPALARPNRFEKTHSGFVARTDAAGLRWEVVVRGLRNPFGIDFNPQGDMFTYDADAEHDSGSSWYRPTRIDHLLPGSDFLWRRVTKQWPPYFPDRADMPRPTLDIGKGSPTAVEFGTKSSFPPRYRRALYALDWTYGRILAVHLSPRGASYAAGVETFLRGQPLNVTDVEFGADGAMYFTTGGRGTQSALYRVRYTGEKVSPTKRTVQQQARDAHADRSRRTRRQLESYIGRQHIDALGIAWPHLSSSDPWIRHAARLVVESQPTDTWRKRALDERNTDAQLAALMALARVGAASDMPAIVEPLFRLPLRQFTERQKLEALFLLGRYVDETTESSDALRLAAIGRAALIYPDASSKVNERLSLMLSEIGGPAFVQTTMSLLLRAPDQRQQFHYLYVLRGLKDGWTNELRQSYFLALRQMDDYIGGAGMPTFRRSIRSEALAAVPADRRASYEKLLAAKAEPWLTEVPKEQRPLVRKWTIEELEGVTKQLGKGHNFDRGRKMFAVARCVVCHQMRGRGGVSGPDLTAVSRRFSPRDVLVSVVDPSRIVAPKYQARAFVLKDGRVLVGRIAQSDYRSPQLRLTPDLLSPEKIVTFAKLDVEQSKASKVSPMPTGMLDTLNKDEILDLLAYILAAGDAKHPMFKR